MNLTKLSNSTLNELGFQVLLHLITLLFIAYDQEQGAIVATDAVFFVNYALGAFLINYIGLPKFYYSGKYLHFALFTCGVLGLVIVVEELVLEPIYFPQSRGTYFPGVHFTLLEIFPSIVLLSGGKFAWDAFQKQREVNDLKAVMKESELQFLNSQIHPHFLFNNLNNLYSYALIGSPQTPYFILKLSSLLRYMLYECNEKFVPLAKEAEQLENFTELSQLQVEDRGKVNFLNQVQEQGYVVAPLILIVFIENAFKHSQNSQSENILIDVRLSITEDGILHFQCINSHAPVTDTLPLTKGIGLKNVKKRLNLLYPKRYKLEICETDQLYKVALSLKLHRALTA